MKIYLAGKITGDAYYWRKFNTAAEKLADEGHIVLNPAELPPGMDSGDYMQICFAMINSADVVIFLPDWKESKGAKLEHDYCEYIGKAIVLWEHLDYWLAGTVDGI